MMTTGGKGKVTGGQDGISWISGVNDFIGIKRHKAQPINTSKHFMFVQQLSSKSCKAKRKNPQKRRDEPELRPVKPDWGRQMDMNRDRGPKE